MIKERKNDIGNFVEFAGCAQCEDKKCLPGTEEDRKACPHYKEFTSLNITDKYVAFWGGVFSNFYPCKIHHIADPMGDGDYDCVFNSSEQYFMWMKAVYFGDEETAREITKAKTPKEAKALGRTVRDFSEEEWEKFRETAMETAAYEKFKQNPELQRYLINPVTETRSFVEGSPYDKIWGVGISWDDPAITDKKNWKGKNLLGKVLDYVREKIKEEA